MSSSSVLLSGQLSAPFERGVAIFKETIVTGHPGEYNLRLSFSDDRIEPVDLKTGLQFCKLGEESVLNNTACQKCEIGTYSIEQPLSKCKECPMGCACKKWGIAPMQNNWSPSPCIAKAQECLSEDGCHYGMYFTICAVLYDFDLEGRIERIDSFFDGQHPTCDLNETELERYRNEQCSEVCFIILLLSFIFLLFQGYDDKICGSCSTGYGLVGLNCRKCVNKAIIVFLMLINVLWFCLLAGISMKGNLISCKLTSQHAPRNGGEGPSKPQSELAELYVMDPNNPDVLPSGSQAQTNARNDKVYHYDVARRGIAERFKVQSSFICLFSILFSALRQFCSNKWNGSSH